jgi:hypothetical protein
MRATRRAGVGAALLALALVLAGAPARALEIKQGSGTAKVTFLLVQAADHTTPATGLTPVVTVSKAGGAFGAGAGSPRSSPTTRPTRRRWASPASTRRSPAAPAATSPSAATPPARTPRRWSGAPRPAP